MNNGLSLAKIISGLSKTLSIARQAIPLYKEFKPMLEKSSNFLSSLNNSSNNKNNNEVKQINKSDPKKINTNNNPQFFQ